MRSIYAPGISPVTARPSSRLRAAASGTKMPYQSNGDAEDPVCAPSVVSFNNDACEDLTRLDVRVRVVPNCIHVFN